MNVGARVAGALVVGLVIGAGAGVVLGGDEPETLSPAPTTTTTVPATGPGVDVAWVEGGVRFRSSVLVPLAFVVDEGRAEIEFDVVPLHWTVDEETIPEEIPVQPERWVLETTAGAVLPATTVLGDDVVRWEVAEDLTPGDVAEVRVVGWRLAVPVGEVVTVPLESGARATFSDGAEIEIDTVLDQLNSTIVQLGSMLPDDPWYHGSTLALIAVDDPGWRVGFRFGQSSNVQLIWAGGDAPGSVDLVQGYPNWIPIAAETVVIGSEGRP